MTYRDLVVRRNEVGEEGRVSLYSQNQQLGFPLRLIGQSEALIIPQQIGPWWMEPLTSQSKLPSRAQERYQAILASGIKLRGAVLFHEIPKNYGRHRSPIEKLLSRIYLWTQQELPVLSRRKAVLRAEQVQQRIPVMGNLLYRAAYKVPTVALILGTVVTAGVSTAAVLGAVITDPCLVVVTEEGEWIEVDRWDE